jgi:peptidoglycan/LPS O-acetylase OafA/YrhL
MAVSEVDFSRFERTKYFPSLDGLRALCVLLVMFNHIQVAIPPWIFGWMGVDVFFVLSGFLITTLLLREKERTGRVSLKGFYTRRFFRIIPIYLFTILLYAVVLRVTHDHAKTAQFKAALPWLLTFMQEYRPAADGTVMGHAWTLGIEEKFYALWPLLVLALFPFRGRALIGLGLTIAVVLTFPHDSCRSYGGLLIGAVLAIALSNSAHWTFVRKLPAIPNAVLLLLVLGTYTLSGHSPQAGRFPLFVLLFSGSIALLIASLVLRTGLTRTVLENPVLVYIGKRSYALYLIHVLALNAVTKILQRFMTPNWVEVVGIAYVVGILGAELMHAIIERPCIAVGRRLSKQYAAKEFSSPQISA